MLGGDDRFQLTNRSKETVLVQGYDKEPYARITPDGTVAVNHNSPAFYLNTDRYGAVTVPKTASAQATPDWQVLDKTGVFEWHDHRMHYMSRDVPPIVKDKTQRTKIFDYDIPIKIGATQGQILGTLWWAPAKDGGRAGGRDRRVRGAGARGRRGGRGGAPAARAGRARRRRRRWRRRRLAPPQPAAAAREAW